MLASEGHDAPPREVVLDADRGDRATERASGVDDGSRVREGVLVEREPAHERTSELHGVRGYVREMRGRDDVIDRDADPLVAHEREALELLG